MAHGAVRSAGAVYVVDDMGLGEFLRAHITRGHHVVPIVQLPRHTAQPILLTDMDAPTKAGVELFLQLTDIHIPPPIDKNQNIHGILYHIKT